MVFVEAPVAGAASAVSTAREGARVEARVEAREAEDVAASGATPPYRNSSRSADPFVAYMLSEVYGALVLLIQTQSALPARPWRSDYYDDDPSARVLRLRARALSCTRAEDVDDYDAAVHTYVEEYARCLAPLIRSLCAIRAAASRACGELDARDAAERRERKLVTANVLQTIEGDPCERMRAYDITCEQAVRDEQRIEARRKAAQLDFVRTHSVPEPPRIPDAPRCVVRNEHMRAWLGAELELSLIHI